MKAFFGFFYEQNEDDGFYTIAIHTSSEESAKALIWKLFKLGTTQINIETASPYGYMVGSTKFSPKPSKFRAVARFVSRYKPTKRKTKKTKKAKNAHKGNK